MGIRFSADLHPGWRRHVAAPTLRSGPKGVPVSEIVFVVEDAQEGGLVARALGASIVTEADDLAQLRQQVRDAVRCHFDEGRLPTVIRLHYVREEVFAA